MKFPCALVALFFLSIVCAFADTQQPGAPIEVGSSCSDSDGSYLWITSTKTLWSIVDATLSLPGIVEPETWSNYDSFHSSLWAGLSQNPGISDFAQRIALICPNYSIDNAYVLASLRRSISETTRIVTCSAGVWTVGNSTDTVEADNSGWLPVSDQMLDATDAQATGSSIQAFVDMLNAQPGANTEPVDGYVYRTGDQQ